MSSAPVICAGSARSADSRSDSASLSSAPRASAARSAISSSTVNWQVKALVEATPISGPA